jgi:hypothetical protein
MKKTITPYLLIASSLLLISVNTSKAQTTPASQPKYRDMVTLNPNDEKDLQVVSDFLNALVSGDADKAKNFTTNDYKGYGPGPNDSTTIDSSIAGWKANYNRQSNRKINFISQTFKVTSGPQQGEWVAAWGDYNFTENGKDVRIPFQYTAHVTSGKIDRDILYYDRLNVMQTLGYKVTPPNTGQ